MIVRPRRHPNPWNGGSDVPYWDQLETVVAGLLDPVTLYYGDESYFALIAGDIAGIVDVWPLLGADAHDGAQAVAARRVHWNAATGLMEFRRASNKHWLSDFTIPEVADDRTIAVGHKLISNGADMYYADFQTGRLILQADYGADEVGYYDGAQLHPAANSVAVQSLLYELKAGAATASVRRDGALLGAKQNFTARALGGAVAFGTRYNGNSAYALDADVKAIPVYTGASAAGSAAIESVMAAMKAEGLFG